MDLHGPHGMGWGHNTPPAPLEMGLGTQWDKNDLEVLQTPGSPRSPRWEILEGLLRVWATPRLYLEHEAGEVEVPGQVQPQAGIVGVLLPVLQLHLHQHPPPAFTQDVGALPGGQGGSQEAPGIPGTPWGH